MKLNIFNIVLLLLYLIQQFESEDPCNYYKEQRLSNIGVLRFEPWSDPVLFYSTYCAVLKGSFYFYDNNTAPVSVAVKLQSDKLMPIFENELSVYTKIKHEYILECYGFEVNMYTSVMVTHLCDTDIYNHCCGVQEQVFHTYSMKDLIVFAKQIAVGMEYLHAHGIAHRDLKGSNLFLKRVRVKKCYSSFVVKIGVSILRSLIDL